MMNGKAGVIVIGLLIVALVVLTGCTGTGNSPATAPQATTSQVNAIVTTIPIDPIVGIWVLVPTGDTAILSTYTFTADGRVTTKVSDKDVHGTWLKIRENQYQIAYLDNYNRTELYIYNPEQDTLSYPSGSVTAYRAGKQPTVTLTAVTTIIPVETPSPVKTTSSILKYSGSGDDVKSFTATGSGLRIFTMRHSGSHNFAVILKDANGEWVALLANEIGPYSGRKSEVLNSGKYFLDITADGSWTVEISNG